MGISLKISLGMGGYLLLQASIRTFSPGELLEGGRIS